MKVDIFSNKCDGVSVVADGVEELIRSRAAEGREAVLGLATGSTPIPLYRELVRRHREEGLSFANVVSFNLDEYEGLGGDNSESYWYFMQENLFKHVDMRSEATHVPPGMYAFGEEEAVCAEYEAKIREAGGLDWQLLGIGRTGHIGFNEPGAGAETRTRRVKLAAVTREDAAETFGGLELVPEYALTMGVATILEARQIVMVAWGAKKSEILERAFRGEISAEVPASFLQQHANVHLILDTEAAEGLSWLSEFTSGINEGG